MLACLPNSGGYYKLRNTNLAIYYNLLANSILNAMSLAMFSDL